MKIQPTKSGAAEFLRVFNDTMENTTTMSQSDPKRLYNLRCSQLPYCPASVLVKWATTGLNSSMDFMMSYYVSVGTAVHEVMQNYLCQSGTFLADYYCKECGTKHPLSYKYECCGFPTQYNEVSIDIKTKRGGIQGHVDGIFKDSNGRLWVVDFKTSSTAAAPSKVHKAPPGYRRQVRAYAYLLKKQHGIDIYGLMLVYLPRDNPRKPSIWEYVLKKGELDDIKEELKADLKLHFNTMKAATLDDMKPLLKHHCGGDYCDACKMPTETKLKLLKTNLKKFPIK